MLGMLLSLGSAAWAQSARLPAELLPYQKVTVTARVTGIVEKVPVDKGSLVKEGDLLIELSAPEMKAQIAEAEARVQAVEAQKAEAEARRSAAQSTYEKLRTASATPGAVASNDVVQAAKQAEAAQALIAALEKSAGAARAQVNALKELEAYLRIAAPFSGVITERLVHPGALASPSAGGLLELEQVSRLRLVVAVPEAELKNAPRGSRVTFTVPAHAGRVFSGVIVRVPRSLDAKTRTMAVEADVDNTSGALAPGMYAEVTLPSKAK